MDAKTLEALRGSIAKWAAIVDGTGADEGMDNCPLCKEFAYEYGDGDDCFGCPVRERTGKGDCYGSPYSNWRKTTPGEFPHLADTPEKKAAAQAELDFLISLLPEGGQP